MGPARTRSAEPEALDEVGVDREVGEVRDDVPDGAIAVGGSVDAVEANGGQLGRMGIEGLKGRDGLLRRGRRGLPPLRSWRARRRGRCRRRSGTRPGRPAGMTERMTTAARKRELGKR
jgi:hypothetical protein